MVKDLRTKGKSPHVGRAALSLLVAVSMTFSTVPAYAVEEVLEQHTDIELVDAQPEAVPEVLSAESPSQTYVSDVVLPSNDELLDAYAQQRLDEVLPGGDGFLTVQADAGGNLTGASAKMYTELKKVIKKVAAGEEHSTVFP